MWAKHKKQGFTIIELLIVIVVIAILAVITIVAYNGVQQRARVSSVNAALNLAVKKISLWQVDNPGVSPSSLNEVGLSSTSGNVAYAYEQNNGNTGYCVTATSGDTSFNVSSPSTTPQSGICPGYNLLAWSKPGAPTPIPSATVDTSVFRTSTASLRLPPNATGINLRNNPQSGDVGQTYRLDFWMLSDANWNGLGNNSKIRFGTTGGGLITACSYNGVKTSWTFVSCSYTLTSTNTQVVISVGNDGTVGNIWIDDLVLTRS